MKEIWKEIKGYEGYEVSNTGKVRGKNVNELKPRSNGNYYFITLSNNGDKRNFYIHRLVAIAFLPNPDCLPQVNHKDENTYNNSVDNLEWCTNQYNQHYSKTYLKGAEASKKKVLQYDMNNNLIKEWNSQSEAARALNIRQNKISDVCCGVNRSYKGYIWRFKVD